MSKLNVVINQSGADTGRPKTRREIDGLAKKKVKDDSSNEARIFNKARDAERKNNPPAKKKKGGYKKLSDSQKLSNKIRREFKRKGEILTNAEVRLIKIERKTFARIGSISQEKHYYRTVVERRDERATFIILMAVTRTIRGKLDMPRNASEFKDKSIAMAKVQTDNTSGYYTPAFGGLALWITRNGTMDTAVKAKIAGTGTATLVKAARVQVKLSLNLFIVYLNTLALANQVLAESIITTALCLLWKTPVMEEKDFTVTLGPGTGAATLNSAKVKIDGKVVKNTFEFQKGYLVGTVIVWDTISAGGDKKIVVNDLPLVTTSFRKRVTTKKGGTTPWCPPITVTIV